MIDQEITAQSNVEEPQQPLKSTNEELYEQYYFDSDGYTTFYQDAYENNAKHYHARHKHDAPAKQGHRTHTPQNLNPIEYWNCCEARPPPPINRITKLHVYDFDGTMFSSPLPNYNFLDSSSVGYLMNNESLHHGGWFCNEEVLECVVADQELCNSSWNLDVLELLRYSERAHDTLTIILTGRSKKNFQNIFWRLLSEVFCDAKILKQGEFRSTLEFKTQVLTDILDYYYNIEEVAMFDDNLRQINGFRKCLNEYIEAVRPNIIYNLIPVKSEVKFLRPLVEKQIIIDMLDSHNKTIDNGTGVGSLGKVFLRQSLFYEGYIVETESKVALIKCLLNSFSDLLNEEFLRNIKFDIGFIPISKGKLSKALDIKLKKHVQWRVHSMGHLDRKLFAVLVTPLNTENFKALNNPPILGVASALDTDLLLHVGELGKIDNWEQINYDVVINTVKGQINTLKIVSEAGKLKHKKKSAVANDNI